MQAALSFEDVLGTALARAEAVRPARAGIGTLGLFAAPIAPGWRGVSAFRQNGRDSTLIVPQKAPEPLLRPRTDAEREAWRRLQHVGAGLPPAFTASHLKRAFRRLARQLHPDGHPGLGADARARLCEQFAEARDAYLSLLAIGC